MKVQLAIEEKLANGIDVKHLEVVNESNNHNVPAGSESHFKVVLVSDAFEGQSLIARHRTINKLLEDELKNQIHALALHTYTEAEWRDRHGEAPMSPPCRGGSKAS
jgi:BolA family transcriptional regulator, general stress-responsive regulator